MRYKPLINILIRTSNRPNYFNRLIGTIKRQTYKNVKLHISADTVQTIYYVNDAGYSAVCIDPYTKSSKLTFPWNLYLNDLLGQVKKGWILIIDDDDMLAHNRVLENLAVNLTDQNSMIVFKMRFPDGRIIPDDDNWGRIPFKRKQIAMPCFAFHSKWKNTVRFDGQRAGDFRFINGLLDYIGVEWFDEVVVQLDNYGNVGKRIDLKDKN
nr:glycosyltransferase family 2 protein [Bacteroidota bacterium]